jgi:flagellar export protein FliJ
MPQAHLRLDKVHHIRQNAREQRRIELLEAQQAEDQVAAQVVALQSDLRSLRGHLQSATTPGQLNLDDLRHAQRYERSLRGELESAQSRCEALSAEVERRRHSLVEADREVKVLDRWQEKQQVQFRIDQARREAKHDDQAIVAAYARSDSKVA